MSATMRWSLVSGDGLPVSGLLTIFRNVVDRAVRWQAVTLQAVTLVTA